MQTLYVRSAASPFVSRSLGARSIYAPAIPKRPNRSFLSQKLSGPSLGAVNIDTTTVIAALGGGIAVLASKALPEPGPMIAKVVGFAALGFAVYRAFFEDSGVADDAGAGGVPGKSTPISAAAPFSMVSGTILSPSAGERIGPGAFRTAYPARVLFSNKADSEVPFLYQIVALEKPSYLYGADKSYWTPNQGVVAQGNLTLKPREQRPVDLKLDTVTSWPATADYIEITLTLQKRQSAESQWQTLSTVTFTYQRWV